MMTNSKTLAAAALLIACGQAAQSQSVMDLPKSGRCSVSSTLAMAGGSTGDSKVEMKNDGGWCWINLFATNGSLQFVPSYHVIKPPAHGELVMGTVDKKARIAYRPVAGFVGVDTYTLMNTTTNSERVVTVSVTN
jgi:hypothetical protein